MSPFSPPSLRPLRSTQELLKRQMQAAARREEEEEAARRHAAAAEETLLAAAASAAGATPKPRSLDVSGGGGDGPLPSSAAPTPAASLGVSGKRRRGAPVDYAAMDLKLRQEEALARRRLQEERLSALASIQ